MKDQDIATKDASILELFWTFFKLGLFTIGGGMAMIPLIQSIAVDKTKWLKEEEAIDLIAVSQGLPGVIAINMATAIGYRKKGILGASVSTVGVVLPSLVIIILIVEVLRSTCDYKWVKGALVGIKACATGLIAFSAYKVGSQVLKDAFNWILALVSFVLMVFTGLNGVYVILGGIFMGIIWETFREHRRSEKK